MNAMHVCVFAYMTICKHIKGIKSDSEATGIANIMGNKGGIGISF